MAITNILYKKEPGKIGSVQLDVTISENHSYKGTITKYPVEGGADITDHIVNDPVVLTMNGFITNSPINFFGGEAGPLLFQDRAQNAFTELLDLREIKEVFSVVTGLKVYRSMVFQDLTFPRDRATGESLRFNATLVKMQKVNSKKIEAQNLDQGTTEPKENVKDLSAEKTEQGSQTVTEPNTEEKTRTTALKGLYNFLSGAN